MVYLASKEEREMKCNLTQAKSGRSPSVVWILKSPMFRLVSVITTASAMLSPCILVALLVLVIASPGCQSSQSPQAPTDKRVIVQIEGSENIKVEIHYHQTTTVDVGGGNSSDQTMDNKGEVKIPFVP